MRPEGAPKNLRDLSHAEFLSSINQISKDLKQDQEARSKSAREEVMKIKIAEYRHQLGEQQAADLTDEDIQKILMKSEERRGKEN